MASVMRNQRPARLPIYEHIISPRIIEQVLGHPLSGLLEGGPHDLSEFSRHYVAFFRQMTYDCVSFEVCITEILPGHGAILGGQGPIQSRQDFDRYPWADLPALYWRHAAPLFDALVASLPPGAQAIGGVGNGVFEISEDLVGLEYLPFLQADDPPLYAVLYQRIGDLMATLWAEFLQRYGHAFLVCRFGDDLGFRSSLLTSPSTIRSHIFPQYQRIIDLVHRHNRFFLWHSCGCIFRVMDDAIALGIDAKHSNEDAIAPFPRWIELYGRRIGLLGGFDMDFLCRNSPAEIRAAVVDLGAEFRAQASGYALGSGNSIPDYVPVENYLALIDGARILREREA
jgi:uroporphyrinogen decarboxylase